MPISQSTGAFNVGRDCTVVLIGPFGRVDIPNVTMFSCKQETANIKIDRLDGVQLMAELPKGWTFTIEAERSSNSLDTLFARTEAAWYQNGAVLQATLYQYINEVDGSTSTYQMDNVSLKYDDPGDWKGDASVKQRVSGMANTRKSV